ncbi:MAG: hypothetical protein M0001_03045 [Treponema sp.]|nr:hypothetical protein [Treponema sp.]
MAKSKGGGTPVPPPPPVVAGNGADSRAGAGGDSDSASVGDAKKRFLLRLDPAVWAGLEKWAADELRSVNAEIEFLLKEALRKAGRLR